MPPLPISDEEGEEDGCGSRSESPVEIEAIEEVTTKSDSPRELRESVNSQKANYLWKLGIVGGKQKDPLYQPRETRPKQHCTVIIFDWDDTLLCTSALQFHRGQPLGEELESLASAAADILTLARDLGMVMIITNAAKEWVYESCGRYLSSLMPVLENIPVISARDKFEKKHPGDPTKWKVDAFCEVKENSSCIANLVALGDSSAEMEALHEMSKLYKISYTKTLKFKAVPTCLELRKELELVQGKLRAIVCAAKNYDIKLHQVRKA